MLGAVKDLLNSEKGLAFIVLAICATVLTGMGHTTWSEWSDFTKFIFVTYVAGKTVTSGVAMVTNKSDKATDAKDKPPEGAA